MRECRKKYRELVTPHVTAYTRALNCFRKIIFAPEGSERIDLGPYGTVLQQSSPMSARLGPYGTTELGCGTTNVDAGVGIGSKKIRRCFGFSLYF